jgi:hypothetical protein
MPGYTKYSGVVLGTHIWRILQRLLASFVLAFQDGAQGISLAAIVGGGADAYADEWEGAFFANLGGSFALGDFVDELAVA